MQTPQALDVLYRRRRPRPPGGRTQVVLTATPGEEGADPGAGEVMRLVSPGVLHRNDRFSHLCWQNYLSVDPASKLSVEMLTAEPIGWWRGPW